MFTCSHEIWNCLHTMKNLWCLWQIWAKLFFRFWKGLICFLVRPALWNKSAPLRKTIFQFLKSSHLRPQRQQGRSAKVSRSSKKQCEPLQVALAQNKPLKVVTARGERSPKVQFSRERSGRRHHPSRQHLFRAAAKLSEDDKFKREKIGSLSSAPLLIYGNPYMSVQKICNNGQKAPKYANICDLTSGNFNYIARHCLFDPPPPPPPPPPITGASRWL